MTAATTKEQLAEQARQLAEFVGQGGKVEQIPRGKSGYVEGQSRSAWGAPRKKAVVVEEIKSAKKTKKK
jgi:hypothetical protein